jgi:hypothetical protein
MEEMRLMKSLARIDNRLHDIQDKHLRGAEADYLNEPPKERKPKVSTTRGAGGTEREGTVGTVGAADTAGRYRQEVPFQQQQQRQQQQQAPSGANNHANDRFGPFDVPDNAIGGAGPGNWTGRLPPRRTIHTPALAATQHVGARPTEEGTGGGVVHVGRHGDRVHRTQNIHLLLSRG